MMQLLDAGVRSMDLKVPSTIPAHANTLAVPARRETRRPPPLSNITPARRPTSGAHTRLASTTVEDLETTSESDSDSDDDEYADAESGPSPTNNPFQTPPHTQTTTSSSRPEVQHDDRPPNATVAGKDVPEAAAPRAHTPTVTFEQTDAPHPVPKTISSATLKGGPRLALPPHLAPRSLHVHLTTAPSNSESKSAETSPEESQLLSAVSYPGTPFYFGNRGNESETSVGTSDGIRPPTRRNVNGDQELSVVHEFFDINEEDGPSPFSRPGINNLLAPSSALKPGFTPSIFTVVSNGTLSLELEEMCDFIVAHPSLQNALIMSTETYGEKMGMVFHRFLILELSRPGKKDIWLRLERKREQYISTFTFLAASGVSRANDVAQLAARKEKLVGKAAKRENRQMFGSRPTLSHLERLLRVVCEEITTYKVWPANCWFFCSLLQEHLGTVNESYFIEGRLQHVDLAPQVRDRVNMRLHELYPSKIPRPLSRASKPSRRSSSKRSKSQDAPSEKSARPRPPLPKRRGTETTVDSSAQLTSTISMTSASSLLSAPLTISSSVGEKSLGSQKSRSLSMPPVARSGAMLRKLSFSRKKSATLDVVLADHASVSTKSEEARGRKKRSFFC